MSEETTQYEVKRESLTGWSPTPTPTGKIALALSKAQGTMGGAKKGSVNPFYKSKYADLGAVCQACRVELAENEIAITQVFHDPGVLNVLLMETIMLHSSGERLHSMIRAEHKPGPQEMGKCMTYLRRYGLVAAVVIPQEDDDGNSAQRAYSKPQVQDPRNQPGNPQANVAQADKMADEIAGMGRTSEEQADIDLEVGSLKAMIEDAHQYLKKPDLWTQTRDSLDLPKGKLETWDLAPLRTLRVYLEEKGNV